MPTGTETSRSWSLHVCPIVMLTVTQPASTTGHEGQRPRYRSPCERVQNREAARPGARVRQLRSRSLPLARARPARPGAALPSASALTTGARVCSPRAAFLSGLLFGGLREDPSGSMP